jgi:hypothetical protein
MEEEPYFEIFDTGDFIRIIPVEYNNYNSEDEWDKNWIKTRIEVKAGVFNGKYMADLMTVDFESFRKVFNYIYDNLAGEGTFADTEGYIEIHIKGDGIGHFEAYCKACDNPGYMERTLEFYLNFDQTQIMPMLRQLNTITAQFPAVGNLRNTQ